MNNERLVVESFRATDNPSFPAQSTLDKCNTLEEAKGNTWKTDYFVSYNIFD